MDDKQNGADNRLETGSSFTSTSEAQISVSVAAAAAAAMADNSLFFDNHHVPAAFSSGATSSGFFSDDLFDGGWGSLFDLVRPPSPPPPTHQNDPAESPAAATPAASTQFGSPSISSSSDDAAADPPKKDGGDGGDKAPKEQVKGKKKGQKRQREPRYAFKTKSDVEQLDDGYRWRKYGQKAVKNSPFPRSYYRCTTAACGVKKRVERSSEEPSVVITTYEGQHTHRACPVSSMPRGGPCSFLLQSNLNSAAPHLLYQTHEQPRQPLAMDSTTYFHTLSSLTFGDNSPPDSTLTTAKTTSFEANTDVSKRFCPATDGGLLEDMIHQHRHRQPKRG